MQKESGRSWSRVCNYFCAYRSKSGLWSEIKMLLFHPSHSAPPWKEGAYVPNNNNTTCVHICPHFSLFYVLFGFLTKVCSCKHRKFIYYNIWGSIHSTVFLLRWWKLVTLLLRHHLHELHMLRQLYFHVVSDSFCKYWSIIEMTCSKSLLQKKTKQKKTNCVINWRGNKRQRNIVSCVVGAHWF